MAKFLDILRRSLEAGAPKPPVAQLIGFELVEVEEGKALVTLAAAERHHNPMGTVHGGILCDIADAAMGIAYATTLNDDETYTTIELKINYLRPVWETTLTATGRVVKAGRTIGFSECDVTDAKGRLVARAASTLMVLRGEQAKGAMSVRRKLEDS